MTMTGKGDADKAAARQMSRYKMIAVKVTRQAAQHASHEVDGGRTQARAAGAWGW